MLVNWSLNPVTFRVPFVNEKLKYASYNDCVRVFSTYEELTNLSKIGNCSTDEAVDRVKFGDVYDSHALTFFLYNFSALKVIEEFCGKTSDSVMLELGCNNGHVSRLLQRNGFKIKEYWGVDFDLQFCIEGLGNFGASDLVFGSNFMSGDFNKPLKFEDHSFNLVFMQEAFDHCKDRFFYAEQCLNEIKRVLKPGGYAYITLVFEHDYRDLYHWDHNYVWKKHEFENVVSDYFDIVNFNSLMTFDSVVKAGSFDCWKVRKNWPDKLAKMFCAGFVDEDDTAVGAYMLRGK
tara:strand:+ start:482 stop:1351 length:870 start_codon:yes stop_codon:yes gene_type:complete